MLRSTIYAVFTLITMVNFTSVQSQKVSDGIVWLQQGQEFYSTSIIVDDPNTTKKKFAYGGWKKGIDSDEVWARIENLDYPTNVNLSSDGPVLLRFTKGNMFGMFPNNTWMFVTWVKDIPNTSETTELLDLDGNPKLFTPVSNLVVYVSSYISMYQVNPQDSYPMYPRVVINNVMLNSTWFFGPVTDSTVLYRSMFYVVSDNEDSLHRSISKAMAGVYRGDIRSFRANKFSYSLATCSITDTTSGTGVGDVIRYVSANGLLVKPRYVVMLDSFIHKDLETVIDEMYDGVRTFTVSFILKDSVVRQAGDLPSGQNFMIVLKSVDPNTGVASYLNLTSMLDRQKQSFKLRLSSGSDLQPAVHSERTFDNIIIDPKAAHHTIALTISISQTKQVDSFFNMMIDLLANVIVSTVVGTYSNEAYTYQRKKIFFGPVIVYFDASTTWSIGAGHMIANPAPASGISLNGLEAFLDTVVVHRGGIAISKDMIGISNPDGVLNNCIVKSVSLVYSNAASRAAPYCILCSPYYILDTSNGQCVKSTDISTRNTTCKEHYNINECVQCDFNSYYYNVAEQVCHPKSTGCPTSTHSLVTHVRTSFDPISVESCTNKLFLPAVPVSSLCTYFSTLNPVTNLCSCRVPFCNKCLFTECDECTSTYYLTIAGKKRECVQNMPAYHGSASASSTMLVAMPCEESHCTDCSVFYRECVQCPTDYFLFDSASKTCLQCKPSQGRMIASGACSLCHNECGTCTVTGSNTACLSCHPDRILSSTTTPTTCIPCVTTGKFKLDPYTCGMCNSNCLNCSGASNRCTACNTGELLFDNQTCGSVCPPSGFYIGAKGSRCATCHSSCLTCNGTSNTNCITCQPPLAFYNQNMTCAACEISNGWYVRTSDNTCRKCSPTCKSCTGDEFNKCLTCINPLVIQLDNSCQYASIELTEREFDKYKMSAIFTFSTPIMFSNGTNVNNNIEVGIFNNPSINLEDLISSVNSSKPLEAIPNLNKASATIKSIILSEKTLTVALQSDKGFENAVVLVRFINNVSLLNPANESYAFMKPAVGIGNISIVKSNFDAAVESIATAATLAITIATLPQAFILLRLMNSLDLYVFIDLVYPSNFDTVLKMMSSTVMDFIPNAFKPLGTDEGDGLPARFEYFGYNIDFFDNVGSTLTIACIILLVKLLTLPFKKYSEVKNSKCVLRLLGKLNVVLDTEFAVGYLEANHVDLILAICVYLTVGEPYSEWSTNRKVIALLLILAVVTLIALYILLVIKTSRLRKLVLASENTRAAVQSDDEHPVRDHDELARDLKNESFAFLVIDKQTDGNAFQTYFTVVMLLREALMCIIVYFMLSMPKVVVAVFGVIQLTFTGLMIIKNPFYEKRLKYTLVTNNVLYLVLNACLLLLAYFNDSLSSFVQYYIVGFTMIAVLFLLILANVGFTLYYTAVGLMQKCKKKPKLSEKAMKKKKLLLQPTDKNIKTTRFEESTDLNSKSLNRLIRDGQFIAEDYSGMDLMASNTTDASTTYNTKKLSNSLSKYKPKARTFKVRDNTTSISGSNTFINNGLYIPSMTSMHDTDRIAKPSSEIFASNTKPYKVSSSAIRRPMSTTSRLKTSVIAGTESNQGSQQRHDNPMQTKERSSRSKSKRLVSQNRDE